jgi:hypothetical protein
MALSILSPLEGMTLRPDVPGRALCTLTLLSHVPIVLTCCHFPNYFLLQVHSALVVYLGLEHASYWLICYTTSRKVSGSRPDEVNEFFSIYLILPAALGPGAY